MTGVISEDQIQQVVRVLELLPREGLPTRLMEHILRCEPVIREDDFEVDPVVLADDWEATQEFCQWLRELPTASRPGIDDDQITEVATYWTMAMRPRRSQVIGALGAFAKVADKLVEAFVRANENVAANRATTEEAGRICRVLINIGYPHFFGREREDWVRDVASPERGFQNYVVPVTFQSLEDRQKESQRREKEKAKNAKLKRRERFSRHFESFMHFRNHLRFLADYAGVDNNQAEIYWNLAKSFQPGEDVRLRFTKWQDDRDTQEVKRLWWALSLSPKCKREAKMIQTAFGFGTADGPKSLAISEYSRARSPIDVDILFARKRKLGLAKVAACTLLSEPSSIDTGRVEELVGHYVDRGFPGWVLKRVTGALDKARSRDIQRRGPVVSLGLSPAAAE